MDLGWFMVFWEDEGVVEQAHAITVLGEGKRVVHDVHSN